MLEHLAILLFALHLGAVNLASTGPLVAAWLDWRELGGDLAAGAAGRKLAAWSIVALLVGIAAGTALGALYWDDHYRLATFRLRSKIYFGVAELAFSLVLMTLQLWCWRRGWGDSRRGRLGRGTLALLASTNLLYHFPLLLTIFSGIVSGRDPGADPLTSSDFRARILDPLVLAHSLHFWLASVAVGGAALMAAVLRELREFPTSAAGENGVANEAPAAAPSAAAPSDAERLAVWGARLALVPTLLQIASGVWLLVQLDPVAQGRLLGGEIGASLVFVVGVGGALWLMHRFANAALGAVSRRSVQVTLAGLALVVLFMTFTLRQLELRARQTRSPVEPASIPSE